MLPRHLICGRAECVVADPESVGPRAHKALQALILALEQQGKVAIAHLSPIHI